MRRLEYGRRIGIQLKLKYINQVGQKHVIFGSLMDITESVDCLKELLE